VRLSIKSKIVLAIGIPLLATYLGMAWSEYYLGKRQALANMESHLTELVARQAAELNGDLSKAEELVRTVAIQATLSADLSTDQIKTCLQENLRANPEMYGMCMAFEKNAFSIDRQWFAPYFCRDQNKGLRYVDIAEVVPDYTSLNWYRPAQLDNSPFWTEPYFDEGVGERIMCTYTAPFFRKGKLRGVLTVDILSKDLLDDIAQVKIGSGYCMLISKKGTIISHPDSSLVLQESIFSLAKRYGLEELAEAGKRMVAGKTGVCRIHDYHIGLPKWMVFAPVESSEWSLAAIVPENEVLAPIYARLARSLGILVAGCIVILGIVLLVSVRVTQPINRLTKAAESLAQGNLDVRVTGVRGSDEIAQLTRTFNTMASDLKTNIDERIREEAARREVEGELRAAREIQASLLPSMLPPEMAEEFSLYAVNAPAKLVAGDFYDFFFVDQRKLAVVMADVSGKGIPAAMYMAVVRTKLRDFASPDKLPVDIITEVNRCLAKDNDRNMFVTMFFGFYDIITGELNYVNAGHNPPYVIRKSGALDILNPTGPLVAPFPDAVFHEARCRLEPQDLLVLFTDGVTEAISQEGQLFGEERLEKILLSLASSPVDVVCQSVIQAARDFNYGDLPDDATLLALRRTCQEISTKEAPTTLPGICFQGDSELTIISKPDVLG
jgi:phosphoserine phosphatase RsbU/P